MIEWVEWMEWALNPMQYISVEFSCYSNRGMLKKLIPHINVPYCMCWALLLVKATWLETTCGLTFVFKSKSVFKPCHVLPICRNEIVSLNGYIFEYCIRRSVHKRYQCVVYPPYLVALCWGWLDGPFGRLLNLKIQITSNNWMGIRTFYAWHSIKESLHDNIAKDSHK